MVMALPRPKPVVPQPYRALGNRVRELRKAAHLTQEKLAEQVGIHRGYPPLIEAGKTRPDVMVLRRIAQVTGGDYNELAALAGYMDAPTGSETLDAPPDKAPVLRRLRDTYSADELNRFERAIRDLFMRPEADKPADGERDK